jgi:putative heme-binding domain-containing protein
VFLARSGFVREQRRMLWNCSRVFVCVALLSSITLAQDKPELSSTAAIQRQPWTVSKVKGSPDPAPPYRVETAFPALTFAQPLDLSAAPGSERLFLAEQGGKIFSFLNRTDAASADLVVDLKKSNPNLTAVYAITFHPQFETNRKAYVCYIEGNDKPDGSAVSEFLVSATDPPTIDPKSERVVIRWWSGGHNGCSLKFGPDGFLYISTGDGGAPSPPDPLMAGQDVSNLLSNILRIDVDHQANDLAYAIPPDNPFVGMPDVRPEIWAFGFRNPWRMSFDRVRGDLWVGDVGWQLWEMVYRVERGGNYGWPIMEGPQAALPESKRGPAPISPPTVSHPHSEAASITGGFVYHGSRLPELKDVYIYGDYQSGKVWGLKHDGQNVTWHKELAQTPVQLVSFGEDNAGEIYLVDYQRSQQIYQLVPNPTDVQQVSFPTKLSETGLFTSVSQQTPSPGVREYSINAPQWADHTSSERWMAVPGTEPVKIESDAKWLFPDGTVLAKTVSLEMTKGDAGTLRRLETQILHRESGSWRPYSYAWNDDQTDAELVSAAGFDRTLKIHDAAAPDGVREQKYRFASRGECQMCHNPWVELKTTNLGIQSASPLAVSLRQWNLTSANDPSANQVTQLQQEGWLTGTVLASLDPSNCFVDPYDNTKDLDTRVRSYLHVNCAHCHQPHAGGSALIDLSYDVKLEETKLLNAKPAQGAFGISGAKLVTARDPFGSVLHYRMAKIGSGRMPRAGSEEVDERAVEMIYDWIQQLPSDPSATSSISASSSMNQGDAALVEKLSNASQQERNGLVQQLASTTRGALALMRWLQNSDVAPEVRREIVSMTAELPQAEIRDLFERFVPASQRAQRLGTAVNIAELLAMESDVERGRQLFLRDGSSSCKNCHKVNGIGENLGPDLSQIGKKYSPSDLLTHLLEPSKFIDAKYIPYILETTDGLVHAGLLVERNDQEIVLKTAQNKEVRVPTAHVESIVSQQKSLMPELLLRDMTPQQAADLLAFLSSLKQK